MKNLLFRARLWLLRTLSSYLSIEDFAIVVNVSPHNVEGGYIFMFDNSIAEQDVQFMHKYLSSFMERVGVSEDRFMVIQTGFDKTSLISLK